MARKTPGFSRGVIDPLYRRYTAAAGYLAPCTLNSAAPPQRVNNSAIPPSVLGGLGSPMGVPKAPPLKGVLVPSTGGGIMGNARRWSRWSGNLVTVIIPLSELPRDDARGLVPYYNIELRIGRGYFSRPGCWAQGGLLSKYMLKNA